jgi:hypothetical protein
MSQNSTSPPPQYPWSTSFQYTVWDVNNNVVSNVTSVTEYWTIGAGTGPNIGSDTWVENGQPLAFDNVVSGSFVDTYGSGLGYTGLQYYAATVGGVPYVISTTNNVIAPAGGAPAVVTPSNSVNLSPPNPGLTASRGH